MNTSKTIGKFNFSKIMGGVISGNNSTPSPIYLYIYASVLFPRLYILHVLHVSDIWWDVGWLTTTTATKEVVEEMTQARHPRPPAAILPNLF